MLVINTSVGRNTILINGIKRKLRGACVSLHTKSTGTVNKVKEIRQGENSDKNNTGGFSSAYQLLQENGVKNEFKKVGVDLQANGYIALESELDADQEKWKKKYFSEKGLRRQSMELVKHLLPKHYETSVSRSYIDYVKWSMGASIFGTVSGVMSMQALLFSIGLGAGAIPMAAATNWILKDGLGQLGGMLCASFVNQKYDAEPRRWRLFAAGILDASVLLEVLTPLCPQYFLPIASFANIGKNVGWISASASRAGIHRSLMREENLADLTGKAGSQTIVSSVIGTGIGVTLSPLIGSSTSAVFPVVTGLCAAHLYCVYRSVSTVNIPTLNVQRLWIAVRDGIDIQLDNKENASSLNSGEKKPSVQLNINEFKTPDEVRPNEHLIHMGKYSGSGNITLEPSQETLESSTTDVFMRVGTPLKCLDSSCLEQLIRFRQQSETDGFDDNNYLILIEKQEIPVVHVLLYEEAKNADVIRAALNGFIVQQWLSNTNLGDLDITKIESYCRKFTNDNFDSSYSTLKALKWECETQFIETSRARLRR